MAADPAVETVRTVAEAAARAGGAVLRHLLCQQRSVAWKTDGTDRSLVTDADYQADAAITAIIRTAFPDHAIYSEEGAGFPENAHHLWVIDPLDGTEEYARGAPGACVAVGYTVAGTPLVGVVYDPFRDELFSAVRGQGARLNGRPIRVSATRQLADAVVAYTSPNRARTVERFETARALLCALVDQVRLVRLYAASALDLCWVAAGRLDAKVALRGRYYDFLAAQVILEEAGGRCTDPFGGPITPTVLGVVGTNGHLHEAVLALVRQCTAGREDRH